MNRFLTLFVGLSSLLVTPLAQSAESVKLAVQAEAAWTHRWDTNVTGQLRDPQTQRWSITREKNRLKGALLNEKGDTNEDWRIAGDLSEGKTPVVRLTIEGPKGALFHLVGKLVKEGQIVGVYYGNDGSSGDFELMLDK